MEYFRGKYRIESTRIQGFDYGSPGTYFVTFNTKGRIPWFGEIIRGKMKLSPIGDIVKDEWMRTPWIRPTVTLDEWCVMPDHVHGIVVIHESQSDARSGRIPFVDWEEAYHVGGNPEKSLVQTHSSASEQKRHGQSQNRFGPQRHNLASIIRGFKSATTKGIHEAGCANFHWQPLYYDHIIRDDDELDRIRQYIIANPMKWETDH